jgi:hypothetical protein
MMLTTPDTRRPTPGRISPDTRLCSRHAAAADRGAWSVEYDIPWTQIDVAAALAQPELLAALRDAALVEAYHPVNLGELLLRTLDDVDAGAVFALELHEGFRHFHALRRYLDAVGYEPAISDAEIAAARRVPPPASATLAARLTEFMVSEHLAVHFFRRLAQRAREPVLRGLLRRIAADEVRHARGAEDLLRARLTADPALVPLVLDAAADFHHYGERAVGALPVAEPGDPAALRGLVRRVERLCGTRLVDHLKRRLDS